MGFNMMILAPAGETVSDSHEWTSRLRELIPDMQVSVARSSVAGTVCVTADWGHFVRRGHELRVCKARLRDPSSSCRVRV